MLGNEREGNRHDSAHTFPRRSVPHQHVSAPVT